MNWKRPLDYYGGRTALEMARVGYDEHKSQHKSYQVNDGGKYDDASFGLYATSLPPDDAPEPEHTIKADHTQRTDATPEPVAPSSAPQGVIWTVVAAAGVLAIFMLIALSAANARKRKTARRRR